MKHLWGTLEIPSFSKILRVSGGPWELNELSEFILWNIHFYTHRRVRVTYLSVGLDCLSSFMCLVIGPIATRPVHPRIFWLSKSRHFSTSHVSQTLKHATTDPKVYSKTLLLPKTSFPLWVDSAKSESLFKRKTCEELYRWQVRFFSQTHQCFSLNATVCRLRMCTDHSLFCLTALLMRTVIFTWVCT